LDKEENRKRIDGKTSKPLVLSSWLPQRAFQDVRDISFSLPLLLLTLANLPVDNCIKIEKKHLKGFTHPLPFPSWISEWIPISDS